jgi:hypothetical protein
MAKDRINVGNKFAEGNKGGRPTKFKYEYVDKIIKFFDIDPYRKEATETLKEYYKDGGLKKESTKSKLIPNKLPTLYQFARSIKVSYWTVWNWAKGGDKGEEVKNKEKYTPEELEEKEEVKRQIKEFSNAYKESKELQKEFLISIGLSGAAPSPFAIFTAKNLTDMRDKTETDITTKGKPIPLLHGVYPDNNIKKDTEAQEEN